MLLLRRHLLPLLRAASSPPSPVCHRACLLSNSTSAASAAPFSLEDYLVTACGLAPAQAHKAAKKALDESSSLRGRLHSASNPDAVLALLSGVGLSRADIAAVVAADPLLLRASTKNIGPRLLALRDRHGLSAPRSSNRRALHVDIERIKPNIALLHQWGVSARAIYQLCLHNVRALNFEPGRLKEVVLRAEEIGVPRSSPLFSQAVSVAANNTNDNLAACIEFLKTTLGACKSDVSTAASKIPCILGMSEECLLSKIQFLTKEVGLEPQYIVERPVLLALSLEKRLVPRHRVMKVLQAKGLLTSNVSFLTFVKLGERDFKLRYIDCHKDSVPGLRMLVP
ncbi:hypothetical protein HU200_043247 [Digitaria exilis]|uniref:Uncharacterized protein n=1 Tax=Digitaria exilis TaxID=1010633 RepID=A0A835B9A3_9POAL|nr:hypothetical protein HU200_043247 [Digitaria exilis]